MDCNDIIQAGVYGSFSRVRSVRMVDASLSESLARHRHDPIVRPRGVRNKKPFLAGPDSIKPIFQPAGRAPGNRNGCALLLPAGRCFFSIVVGSITGDSASGLYRKMKPAPPLEYCDCKAPAVQQARS